MDTNDTTTEQTTETNNDGMITVWSHPDDLILSQYGHCSIRHWCAREVERINANPDPLRQAVIVTDEAGLMGIRWVGTATAVTQ